LFLLVVRGGSCRWCVAGVDAGCDGVVPAGVLVLVAGPPAGASGDRSGSGPSPPVPAGTAVVRGLMDW
jgi:hypothetical protein